MADMNNAKMDIKTLSECLKNAGVVGAGGAGFPSYGKLNEKADTIILNCAECEPLLRLHRQLLVKKVNEILKALMVVAGAVGASRIVVGVKEDYRNTIRCLEGTLPEYPAIELKKLPDAYPMGDEVVLIYEATGRVVRPGGLPIECGVIVYNVETMYNVYRAVFENKPVTQKVVTIVGEVENPCTVRVPIGTTISEAVAMAGKITCKNPVYLLGGPMMGRFGDPNGPITKTTAAVIVLPEEHSLVQKKNSKFSTNVRRAASICCQCQMCTDLCPRHALGHPIEPHLFMRSAANQDFQSMEPFLNTNFCSSCGLCEMFSCPQGLAPRTMIGEYKGALKKAGVKPPVVSAGPVNEARDYRLVPKNRLVARLGLTKYMHDCPLDDELRKIDRVKILLSQHIGAPAIPVVAVGDKVKTDDCVAKAADGLSVNIHASIDGTVEEITDKYLIIVRR